MVFEYQLSFWGPTYFLGAKLLVSGSVNIPYVEHLGLDREKNGAWWVFSLLATTFVFFSDDLASRCGAEAERFKILRRQGRSNGVRGHTFLLLGFLRLISQHILVSSFSGKKNMGAVYLESSRTIFPNL